MEKLSKTIELRGIGQATKATLKHRKGNICMYYRSDDVYEVFIVKTAKAKDYFGVKYEAREVYPTNKDFGMSAWCYTGKEYDRAMGKFNSLVSKALK